MLGKYSRSMIGVGIFGFAVCLLYSYARIIYPMFAYYGYTYVGWRPSVVLVGLLLALVPAWWISIDIDRPSQFVYWVLYVCVYVPCCCILPLVTDRPALYIIAILLVLLLSMVLIYLTYHVPLLKVNKVNVSNRSFWYLMAFLCGGSVVLIFSLTRFEFEASRIVDLVYTLQVYDVRYEARNIVSAENPLLGYIIPWLGNVLIPLVFIFGILHKRLLLVLASVMLQLATFSLTGHKSVLFALPFIAALLVVFRNKGKRVGLYITAGVFGICLLGIGLYEVIGESSLLLVLIRRVIVFPGLLTGYYYDFFLDHPPALLRHSILGVLADYPYRLQPKFIIGSEYFGRAEMSANANIWADGYANFRLAGIVLMSLLLSATMWLYDSLAKHHDFRFAVLLLVVPAFSLSNSALLTCILTHGIGLSMVMLYIMPKTKAPVNKKRPLHELA